MSHPLAARPQAPLAKPEEAPGFFGGMAAFFKGFGYIVTTPAVWPFAMVPVAVAVVLTAILGVGGVTILSRWIEGLVGPHSGVLAVILKILAGFVALVIAAMVGFGLAQPLSGPALERIVRRVAAKEGAPTWPETNIRQEILRSLQSVAVSYAFALPLLAILFVVNLVFPPATVVTFPLKLIVIAVVAAWDFCDYPLSLRGVPVRERVAFVSRHWPAMLGYGAGLALLSLVPCAILLALPAGVAGATRLTVLLERADARAKG